MTRLKLLLLSSLLLGSAGCGVDPAAGDSGASSATDSGAPDTTGGADTADDTGPAPVRFTEVQDAVFLSTCAGAGCHDAVTSAGSLDFESDGAYDRLLFDPCENEIATAEGLLRVSPGNPGDSFLYLKVTDPRGMGDPMPPWGALDEASVKLIEDWILAGALP